MATRGSVSHNLVRYHRRIDRSPEKNTDKLNSTDRQTLYEIRSVVEKKLMQMNELRDNLEQSEKCLEEERKQRRIAEQKLQLVDLYNNPAIIEELRQRLPRASKTDPLDNIICINQDARYFLKQDEGMLMSDNVFLTQQPVRKMNQSENDDSTQSCDKIQLDCDDWQLTDQSHVKEQADDSLINNFNALKLGDDAQTDESLEKTHDNLEHQADTDGAQLKNVVGDNFDNSHNVLKMVETHLADSENSSDNPLTVKAESNQKATYDHCLSDLRTSGFYERTLDLTGTGNERTFNSHNKTVGELSHRSSKDDGHILQSDASKTKGIDSNKDEICFSSATQNNEIPAKATMPLHMEPKTHLLSSFNNSPVTVPYAPSMLSGVSIPGTNRSYDPSSDAKLSMASYPEYVLSPVVSRRNSYGQLHASDGYMSSYGRGLSVKSSSEPMVSFSASSPSFHKNKVKSSEHLRQTYPSSKTEEAFRLVSDSFHSECQSYSPFQTPTFVPLSSQPRLSHDMSSANLPFSSRCSTPTSCYQRCCSPKPDTLDKLAAESRVLDSYHFPNTNQDLLEELEVAKQTIEKMHEKCLALQKENENIKLKYEAQILEICEIQDRRDATMMEKGAILERERMAEADAIFRRAQEAELEDENQLIKDGFDSDDMSTVDQLGKEILFNIDRFKTENRLNIQTIESLVQERNNALSKLNMLQCELSQQTLNAKIKQGEDGESALQDRICQLQEKCDYWKNRVKELEDESMSLRIYYSLHKSLSPETSVRNSLETHENINLTKRENRQLLEQLRRVTAERDELARRLEEKSRSNTACQAHKENISRLERKVATLQKKLFDYHRQARSE